jgi:flagellar biosynthesis chaperone FliJ
VKSIINATYERVCEAYFSIIHQLVVMRAYVEKHLQELHKKNQDGALIMKQHKLHFTTWLKKLNHRVDKTKEKMIHLLASGPHSLVKSWQTYDINGAHSIPRQRTTGVNAKIVVSE